MGHSRYLLVCFPPVPLFIGLRAAYIETIYPRHGLSEEIIGKAIKKYNIPRSKLVILSKCYFGVQPGNQVPVSASATNDGDMVNQVGLSRKHIFDAVEDSVNRLGTYIDVLQIHRLDRDTPKEEIMKALNDVVESGKVRYIGASSYREEEREMLPYCAATGVGCIPWSPINRGALARPWGDRTTTREKTDRFMQSLVRSRENEVDKAIVDRVEELAKKKSVSMAQIATAWVLRRDLVNPIIGLGSKERIDEAVAALKVQLTDEEAMYLEEPYLPKPVTGY
ncbi:MAG: hypothetical protein Q9167_004657 [Letrouitia subvulpina]